MASNRIKGIAVEIGGDTTGLSKALEGVDKSIRSTQSQLRDVEKLLKLDPTNTELLSQKQKLLASSIQSTKDRLDTLKTAAQQAYEQLEDGKISQEQFDALQREIIDTENKLKSLEQQSGESMQKLSDELVSLSGTVSEQQKKLESLKTSYVDVVAQYGKHSKEAKALRAEIKTLNKSLSDNEGSLEKAEQKAGNFFEKLDKPTVLDKVKSKLQALNPFIEKTGKESEESEKSVDKMNETAKESDGAFSIAKGAIATFAGNALTSLVRAAAEAASAFSEIADSTVEFRENLAKLETTAQSAGYSTAYANDAFQQMYGVLGDETAANTTVSNFMRLGASTEDLNSLLESATGIWATYGDSIPLDGLAESVNETAKVGQITGTLADALNWAGVSEDNFNTSLAACSTEQQRQQLIVETLNGLYADSAKAYQENNASIISAREANLAYESSIAKIGSAMEPLTAQFTSMKAEMINGMLPAIQSLSTAFQGLFTGVSGADADIASAISQLIGGALTQIQGVLPQVLTAVSALLTGVLSGIQSSMPKITSTISTLLSSLVSLLTAILPDLITAVISLISGLSNELILMAPQLLTAAITLFSGILNAWQGVDFVSGISAMITSLCGALSQMLPQLLAAATALFQGIVLALPGVLQSLLAQLPSIINTITNFFVTAMPQLLMAAQTMLNALIDAIPLVIQSLVATLPSILHAIANFFVTSIPQLLSAAQQLFMSLVNALPTIIQSLIAALPTLIQSIVQFLMDSIPTLLASALQFLGTIVQSIPKIALDLIVAMPQILSAIVEGLAPLAEKIGEKLSEAWDKFKQWCTDMLEKAKSGMKSVIDGIISFFRELPGKVWDWLCNVVIKVASWALDMQNKAKSAASDFFNGIVNKVKELPSEIWNWLSNVISKVATFATDIGSKAAEAAKELWNNLVDGITGLPEKIYSIGSDIVHGLWNGISDVCGWLWEKISGFCQGIWDNIAGFFGIASPSKLFKEELGFNLVYGLAEGVDEKVKTAVDAVNSMGQDVMQAAKKSLNANWNVSGFVTADGASVVNNYYNTDNSRTVNQTNNSPKALSRLEIYRRTRNALKA